MTEGSNRIRIKLRAYDYRLLEKAVREIIDAVLGTGASISGPVPCPVKIHKQTVQRSVHVDKKSREQFEIRVYSRLLDIKNPTQQTIDALAKLNLPAGVEVEIHL